MYSFFTPEVNRLIDIDYVEVENHLFGNVVIPGSMHDLHLEDIDDPFVREVTETIHNAGHKVYFVGGAVRDWIMEKERLDYDLVSDLTMQEAKELFGEAFVIHYVQEYTFGKVDYPPDNNVDLVTRTPIPQAYRDHRIPEILTRIPLFQDSMRRDLTINALYFDPYSRRIVDFHGGLRDIRDGVINTIFMPDLQFLWDPNSILRSVRFAARYGFAFQEDVWLALKVVGRKYVRNLPPQIAYKNVIKFFQGGYAARSMELLREYALTPELIPSLALSRDKAEYEAYLTRLAAALDEMDLMYFGKKSEFRALIYAALYYPRFLELETRYEAEEAARRTINEALRSIEVPDTTIALLCDYLQRFQHPENSGLQSAYFKQIGALMRRK